ncbi:hypothetical protein QTP86_016364 [Hemibagrus guttatus]|nr:hypothetical protein QTP86_016364 [Hemibagrus guttatus]
MNIMTTCAQWSQHLFYWESAGNLEPIPGASGHKQGTRWTGCQSITRHNHTQDNLEMPFSLQGMSLNWRRKPEYLEETPKAWEEYANSTHMVGIGIEPPNPGSVRQMF